MTGSVAVIPVPKWPGLGVSFYRHDRDGNGLCSGRRHQGSFASLPSQARQQEHALQISMDIEGTTITATLENSEAARDFASLLPLSLTLEDYASTEKISDLPRRLSTAGAPSGITPRVGDVTYYAPWGNLAIFHKDFHYANGLVKVGTLDSGIGIMRRPGPLKVTIRKMSP
ncbi:cyclophilin-like fold protein [uncultured Paraburkholderia sp.]|uniref:cyclophilin-like fold protein n=1 Tax=uncultured Paraburkholderia sp. TaxID=1822466 RepID=UPI00259313F1|nr:cyclophilin-like fold protein [uncultured Paraburkholderia sp.]